MQLYEDVFLNAPLGIYTLDKKGTITSFNPKMAELAGDDPNEVIGLNVFEMESYKKAGLDTYFAKGLKGEAFETEVTYVSQLGHKESIRHYRGVPLQGRGEDTEARLLLLVEDVTERRKAEKHLAETRKAEKLEHERLLALINSLADGVIALDKDQKIIMYNGAALSILNRHKDITGKQIDNVMHITDKYNQELDIEDHIAKAEKPRKYTDWVLHYSDKEYINLYASIAPVRLGYSNSSGHGYVMLLRDITQEKTLEAQRDEFISVVSHELRTPLTIAEAALSTIMVIDPCDNAEKAQNLQEEAHKNIVFLSNIVNDITTLSLAERHAIDVTPEPIEPKKLVQELKQNYHKKVEAKDLKLHTSVSSAPDEFESNPYRLKEILDNLLNNAIKYTDKGSITIKVDTPDSSHIRFSVSDTGAGIKKSDQPHIFERFWRSEDYRTRTHSGTGLGLYLAKRLAERLEGDLTFTSKINHGSTFMLTLPLTLKTDDKKTKKEDKKQ